MLCNNDSKSSCGLCPFAPMLILSIVIAVSMGFQTYLLTSERGKLNLAQNEQIATLAQAEKVKAQLSSLVQGALDLSKKGNKNAADLIIELKKAGVNFQDGPDGQAQQSKEKR